MKPYRNITILIFLLTMTGLVLASAGPPYSIDWSSIDGGGGTSGAGDLQLVSVLGQTDTTVVSGGGFELAGGFLPGASDPPPTCPSDTNGDSLIDVEDLLSLLAEWGPCPACTTDSNGDDVVDVEDLLTLLAAWGLCP